MNNLNHQTGSVLKRIVPGLKEEITLEEYWAQLPKRMREFDRENKRTYILFMDGARTWRELYFKIGRTSHMKNRLTALKGGNPFIETCFTMNGDMEEYFHICLRKFKFKNEWFCIPDTTETEGVIKLIESLIESYIERFNIEISKHK